MCELFHRGRISEGHHELAVRLLPKPTRRKSGRPKGALGDKAYNKRCQLYLDWISEKSLRPFLTKEQFAKERLGITDEDLNGEYSSVHRPKLDARLQEMMPARMKQLDEEQRRAFEIIYPLIITHNQYLAQQWREAKQNSPTLTRVDFLEAFLGWPRGKKRHPIEAEVMREYLERLDQGEKQLTDSDGG
jgi:hypothetical protein